MRAPAPRSGPPHREEAAQSPKRSVPYVISTYTPVVSSATPHEAVRELRRRGTLVSPSPAIDFLGLRDSRRFALPRQRRVRVHTSGGPARARARSHGEAVRDLRATL